ncbi:MAG: nucleoside triphosphate pyrophosphohydrolase [Rikenellaceae bacterium]|jgi:XTP/dITP diphosphohydrolase|nr:nucleoside triphosphate pyrophosphohydrolase [Rikenellaceae bacterium]
MNRKLEAFQRLLEVMDELRVKCPWDREQTFESLRNNTIEETFELVDAIADKDMANIQKELGDLLLHVVFYAKIADEQKEFDIADVANSLCDKLIYRHPHVFGAVDVADSGQVSRNWEALKQREKDRKGGVLSGVPKGMPPLVKAYRIQEKVAAVGFDWEKKEDVWAKVKEEIAEVDAEIRSGDRARLESEFGDLMFALINAARLYGVNPEAALEACNKKFIRRFNHIERRCAEAGKTLRETPLTEMDEYWREAKQEE